MYAGAHECAPYENPRQITVGSPFMATDSRLTARINPLGRHSFPGFNLS